MGRGKRGKRSFDEISGREQERVGWILNKDENTTTTLESYPGEYTKVQCNGKKVRKITTQLFANLDPAAPKLPRIAEAGVHVVRVNEEVLKERPADHPKVSCIRADDIIPQDAQSAIIAKWDELQRLGGLVYSDHGNGDNRSSTPALHCGVWNLSSTLPFVTADTRQQHSDPAVPTCLEELCSLIKTHIAPRIKRMTQLHSPNLWPKQERAHEYVKANVKDPLDQWDCIDFGGAFFTVAIKEGSSERLHVDFNDHPLSLTWLVPLGDWTGGDFLAPQLGEVIPVRPG